jgi:hypothetical protein
LRNPCVVAKQAHSKPESTKSQPVPEGQEGIYWPKTGAPLLSLDHYPAQGRPSCIGSRRLVVRRRRAVGCVHTEQVSWQRHRAGDFGPR